MSIFDGLKLAVDTPARIPLLHPITGQPLRDSDGADAYIEVLAWTGTAGRAFDRVIQDRNLKRAVGRATAEQIEGDMTDKLARLTRGWRLVSLDGVALDIAFSEGNARECYAMPELAWLREQVFQAQADLGNFKPAPSTS